MSQSSTSTSSPLGAHVQSDTSLATQVLDLKRDQFVSFSGTSQFASQSVSACGLAAFNFARIGFRIERSKKSISEVLNELGTREVVEEIVSICAGWSNNRHLEVEEIYELPIFDRCLKLGSVEYGRPGPTFFRNLLEIMKKIERSAVVIITRPPEIIACIKFVVSTTRTAETPVFVVFDSHPRPSHPRGAGLSFSTSIENTARTLSDILPTMDESTYSSSDYDWQVQLLGHCSAHLYIARHRRKDHEEAIVQSSLTILTLRAEVAELVRKNEDMKSENTQLKSNFERLRQEQAKQKRDATSSWTRVPGRVQGRSSGWDSHAVAGPSRTSGAHSRSNDTPSPGFSGRPFPAPSPRAPDTAGAQSIFANNPSPVPSRPPPAYDEIDSDIVGGEPSDDMDTMWIQTTQLAQQLQDQFDLEDRLLRRQQAELVQYGVQVTFRCGICMDELPEDDVANVDGCAHTMCRTCLREFVSSRIRERRFPIQCPICLASAKGKARPGEILRPLIEILGISEEESQILTEMELTGFTVQVVCRKCKRPGLMDREEHTESDNINCPQEDCDHVWCKKCEQTIVRNGPKHSCDGSSELDHLVLQQGWKRCPSCSTPVQRLSGCDHMQCRCGTPFCYACGGRRGGGSGRACRC